MVLLRNSIALVTMKGIGCSLSERQGSKEVPMRNVFLSCGTNGNLGFNACSLQPLLYRLQQCLVASWSIPFKQVSSALCINQCRRCTVC